VPLNVFDFLDVRILLLRKEATFSRRSPQKSVDRYFHAYGTFVLVVSGSLEANGMKKLIEIVYNLLVEAIQLCSFVVGNFGVSPVRLQ
jgi:hypothetical protein